MEESGATKPKEDSPNFCIMDVTEMIPVDGELDMGTMVETRELLWTTFTLKIEKYSELENDIVYCRYANAREHKWTFKIVKMTVNLFLLLQTQHVKQCVNFSIIGKDDQILNSGQACPTIDGQFVAGFKTAIVSDPRNGYLVDDCLVVECKYIEKQSNGKIHVIPWDEHRERIDLENFLNDWKEMYFTYRLWDFKIFIGGYVFMVHKVILAARSGYFANTLFNCTEVEEMTLDVEASPVIFHEVLMFMYTGELKELTLNVMLDVFEMADALIIDTLLKKCMSILREAFSVDNIEKIFHKVKRCKYTHLKSDCIEYIRKNCPEKLKDIGEE